MRLKSLTIKGFKSFADETIINFNENLIGVVGPNGSGKSNVVDAIRWVLGEQKTSELRLTQLSDVIFNGSKARNEGKVARVSLTFDNTKNILPTEYQEVTIGRILYRDGNSEYRLNDVTCRKKDIQSLFIDSGIGSNSYAIISLNMVEDILHDNGGQRRFMIEQAAGISKYKIRKKETLSKLRSTTEDLERVSDLLFEIEKNLKQFEKQARRTEQYNTLREEYKTLSLSIAKLEIDEHQRIRTQLIDNQKAEQDRIRKLQTELSKKEAELEKLKLDILSAEQSLNKDQQSFNQLIEQLGKKENEKNLVNHQIVNDKSRLDELEQGQNGLDETLKLSQDKVEKARKELTKLTEIVERDQSDFEVINNLVNRHRQVYDELRSQEKLIKNQQAQKQQQRNLTEREIESINTRVELLQQDIADSKNRLLSLQQNLTHNKDAEEKSQSQSDELQQKLDRETEKWNEWNEKEVKWIEENQKITQKRNKILVEKSSLEQRKKFLQNVIEKNEGISAAAQYVLKEFDQAILFSDIVEIVDDRYTPIIELFSESWLQYIIVDRRDQADMILDRLSQSQKGKVNILVSEEFGSIGQSPINAGNKYGLPLLELVKVEKKYAPLVSQIWNNVFLVDDTNQEPIADEYGVTLLHHKDYKIVRRGEVFGGSQTLFEGVQLGRKGILEKLNNSILDTRSNLDQIESSIHNQKKDREDINLGQEKCNRIISDLRKQLEQYQRESSELMGRRANIDEQINQLERYVTDRNTQLEEVRQQYVQKQLQLEEITQLNIDELNDDELTQKIGEAYKLIITTNEQREEKQQQLYQTQNQQNVTIKELEFHQKTLTSTKENVSKSQEEKKVLLQRLSQNNQLLEKTNNELAEFYKNKEQLQVRLSDYEDSYYKQKGKIFEGDKEINETRHSISQKENRQQLIGEKIAKTNYDIKAIEERMDIEFGIKKDHLETLDVPDSLVLAELQLKKTKIQEKIRGFGEINPLAITAYNEIKERYNHIAKEQQDILDAKDSLEETIQEIEEAASAKFTESLGKIRTNFKEVFQHLFSDDDDCDIALMQNDNPLEARIEIIAKPKGKKPRSISQLSGGEKTLTATSFLFALYLLKPAPFCIFDEVDAPLDDVNVLKFNQLIKRFSTDSQFVIITHNKLTMAEVDILYGVFLKEPGVSGVSAVDFRDYKEAETLPQM